MTAEGQKILEVTGNQKIFHLNITYFIAIQLFSHLLIEIITIIPNNDFPDKHLYDCYCVANIVCRKNIDIIREINIK